MPQKQPQTLAVAYGLDAMPSRSELLRAEFRFSYSIFVFLCHDNASCACVVKGNESHAKRAHLNL